MVLLDLIGAASPSFFSLYENTDWLFDHLVDIETRLTEKKMYVSQFFILTISCGFYS
jgi:hypothetical protein